MDLAILKAELALLAYTGLSDTDAAAALNAPVVPAVRDVPVAEARALLLATGEWGSLVLLARSQPSAEVPAQAVAAAITAEDTFRLTTTLEATNPTYWAAMQAMVAGLQAAGVLSAETAAALLALRDTTISRAEELGLGVVSAGDVQTARVS